MNTEPKNTETKPKSNASLVLKLVGLVSFMLALSFASVPLYDWFCRVTGWGGVTNGWLAGTGHALDVQARGH